MVENRSAPLRAAIVNLLQKENLSLAGLQEKTGTSLPTLRRAVQALAEADWISALGKNDATGGRPATLYGLNGLSHLIIGAHVESPAVNMVAVDLDGTILEQSQYICTSESPPDEAVEVITSFIAQVSASHPHRRLLGIGMATIGYVDAASGVILYVARAPGWENYPMKARLEAQLNMPVIMENETDCLIRSELFNMNARRSVDTIYLGMLEGLKVSMLLNGRIYSGAFGNAGLIGRTSICPQGHSGPETSGRELEHIASVSGICSEFDVRVRMLEHVDGELARMQDIGDHKKKFYAILDAAEAGEAICVEVVQQMIDNLAIAVCNLIYVLQPLVLIVGGALSNPPPGISAGLENGIRTQLPSLLSNHLVIRYASETGRFAAAKGATRMFLQRFITTDTAFSNQQAMRAKPANHYG